MARIGTRFEEIWNRHKAVSFGLVLGALGLALFAAYHPLSPGISIGLLALMAGIMSVRPEMHIFEKMAWIVILIAFTVLEVRAIGKSDEDNKTQRDAQNQKFDLIAKGLTDAYTLSQQQFSETMSEFSQTNKRENDRFKALVEQDKKLFHHEESLAESLSGVLVPGHYSTPSNPCSGQAPASATFVFMGSNATYLTRFPYTVLAVNGKPVFQIDRHPSGLIFPIVDVRGKDGRIIARLDGDGYVIGNRLQVKRPDPSTLIVIDDYGETTVSVRILNKNSIEISGHLFYRDKELPLGFASIFTESCISGGDTAENINIP